jgi:glyoxylase-like metal-dependent hydrolase (beta-lactamase superfamily II)
MLHLLRWRTMHKLFIVILLAFVASCAPALRAAVGDVGTFTSPDRTFATASYWIEGQNGVVMIDTQFLPREGLQAVEAAERASGKKVVAAIVLHPNPDKFNGTAAFQQRGIRVITSAQVNALIPAVHAIRHGWFFNEYAPDYPKEAAAPDVFGDATTELNLAGLTLKLHVLGRSASGAHVVVLHARNVFVGDLINPENHAWLELGLIDDWLQRLEDIRVMLPPTSPLKIYPGRGAVGGIELIDRQAAYLKQVQAWVREEKPAGDLGWFTKLKLQRKIEQAYPALGYPIFMRDGLAAVWKTEAAKR